jgi:hypothetical protein
MDNYYQKSSSARKEASILWLSPQLHQQRPQRGQRTTLATKLDRQTMKEVTAASEMTMPLTSHHFLGTKAGIVDPINKRCIWQDASWLTCELLRLLYRQGKPRERIGYDSTAGQLCNKTKLMGDYFLQSLKKGSKKALN